MRRPSRCHDGFGRIARRGQLFQKDGHGFSEAAESRVSSCLRCHSAIDFRRRAWYEKFT